MALDFIDFPIDFMIIFNVTQSNKNMYKVAKSFEEYCEEYCVYYF
jgi:hypothetical protein